MAKVIDTFDIPEEIASELSDLLIRQTIRERLMMQNFADKERFYELEELLIPVTAKIEAIKYRITNEFVPTCYNSQRYSWNYDGYEISGTKCQIIDNEQN